MFDRLVTARSLLATGCLFVSGLTTTGALAQDTIFDWGGEDKTATSGKGHVKFNGGGKPGDIIVSFGDRKLYFFTAPGEADTYLVATPRDQSRWEGVTSVTQKRENPSWTPTAHMLQENPKLPHWVPGGHPMNPLGIRALYLGSSDYRIHGTDAPWTIGTPVSKGCVRMFNKDVVDLYPRVKVGTKVIVTWQKFDTRTQSMANLPNKGITELAPGEQSRATVASYVPDAASPSARSKYKRPVEDDQVEVDTAKVDVPASDAPKLASAADSEALVVPRKRKASVTSSEADGVSGEVKEPTSSTSERREQRSVKVKAVTKPDASEDAVASVKSSKRTDQASLSVAERALAAAERAADAAERAAAAAERAVSASQIRSQVQASAPSASEPTSIAPTDNTARGEVTAH